MSSLDKTTIQMYLRHGMGQLILDTSLLVVGEEVLPVDQDVVSVEVREILIGDDEELTGERIMVSTVVDDQPGKEVYGINLHRASPQESFILFLREERPNFTLASVSNPLSILQGCFRVQSEENLAVFTEAMRLLDRYLLPAGSSMAEDFPLEPSLPGCQECLFLLQGEGQDETASVIYRCGRIWIPPSLRGWLSQDGLEHYGEECGPRHPLCWTSFPE